MSFFNYENEIETQVVAQLESANTAFEVNTYYDSIGSESVAEYILAKVKSIPSVFVRCTGVSLESMNTNGVLTNGTYQLEIICACKDNGKARQIKAQNRKVNILIASVLNRLNSFEISLTEQPDQPLVFRRINDLFTLNTLDVRVLTFEVEGVTIDMDEIGSNNTFEDLL